MYVILGTARNLGMYRKAVCQKRMREKEADGLIGQTSRPDRDVLHRAFP